jgi:hypothetical protein
MSDLQRRSGSRLTRKQRETRAYQLTLATGGFSVVAVVGIVLAVFTGVTFFSWPLLAVLLAAASGYGLRRTLNP